MTNLWKYFWEHTRKAWKIHVVFMMVSAGFWPQGSKNHRNKGRWRTTWPGSAVWNHSRVTCVSLHPLHLEVLEVAADSTQRRHRPATGHLAGPDAAFHLFFFSFFFGEAESRQRKSLRIIIIARCCLGTEKHRCLLFQIWRTFFFCGTIPHFHTVIGSFWKVSPTTPPALICPPHT